MKFNIAARPRGTQPGAQGQALKESGERTDAGLPGSKILGYRHQAV